MEKIKAFFAKKQVKMVCLGLFVASCAGLIVGGASVEAINGLTVAIVTVLAAVSALVIYINGLLNKFIVE